VAVEARDEEQHIWSKNLGYTVSVALLFGVWAAKLRFELLD
jgi:hypothetical protein